MICNLCVTNLMIHLEVCDGELYSSMVHPQTIHVHIPQC